MFKIKNRKLKIAVATGMSGLLIAGALGFIWLRQGAVSGDSSPGQTPLPDFNTTKRQADGGEVPAQNALGDIFAEGTQVPQNYEEAARWYRKAAEQNFPAAQYHLGELYDIGRGVPRDEAEAANWYRKAADGGNADAQYTLAGMYSLGRGVPANTEEALKWYHRASEQGDALSMYQLAERYERAKGVSQDFVEAYKWQTLAAGLKLHDAVVAKKNLEAKLTSGQRAEAAKRVRDFQTKFRQK